MSRVDGGPAFPGIEYAHNDLLPTGQPRQVHVPGMSRHDYFAAHAPAMPANFDRKSWQTMQVQEHAGGFKKEVSVRVYESIPAWHARWAKEYADAMVTERAA